MRIGFEFYRDDAAATFCSITGSVITAVGVAKLVLARDLTGFIWAAAGIGLRFLAMRIHEGNQFSVWKRKVEKNGLIPQIQSSIPIALQVYNTNPGAQALEFIRGLNPAAAQLIDQAAVQKTQEVCPEELGRVGIENVKSE